MTNLKACRITSATALQCSEDAVIKTWLSRSVTEWQGHLLGCLVQLEIRLAILIIRQFKVSGLPPSQQFWGRQYWDWYVLILMRLQLFHSHKVQIAMFQLSEGWDYKFWILRRGSLQSLILRSLRFHFFNSQDVEITNVRSFQLLEDKLFIGDNKVFTHSCILDFMMMVVMDDDNKTK